MLLKLYGTEDLSEVPSGHQKKCAQGSDQRLDEVGFGWIGSWINLEVVLHLAVSLVERDTFGPLNIVHIKGNSHPRVKSVQPET